MDIDIKCSLKEAVSKSGNTYTYLSVFLTPTLEKKVFLEQAELELIKIYYQNNI